MEGWVGGWMDGAISRLAKIPGSAHVIDVDVDNHI